MNKDWLDFEITEDRQKESFSNMLDWERNYKRLRCESHLREPRLRLRTGKGGSAVSVAACCTNFFARIVEMKKGDAGLT